MSGDELRAAREALGARQLAVAGLIGVSHQRIGRLERQERVSEPVAERYVTALAALAAAGDALDRVRDALDRVRDALAPQAAQEQQP